MMSPFLVLLGVVSCPTLTLGFIGQKSSPFVSLKPQTMSSSTDTTTTTLFGAFNRRNKQADLMKKMQEAKKQKNPSSGDEETEKKKERLTDEEMKAINDRKRFEELLNRESATVNTDFSRTGNSYLTKEQEEEDIAASERGTDRLFEGDPAPTDPFEHLLSVPNENALSKKGTKKLIPWLNPNSSKQKDYIIVVSDPRVKSPALRKALTNLVSSLNPEMKSRLYFINADTPAENRRWLKKQGMTNTVNMFSDEKREWMREYTALGENRWAICMFILADGRVQKIVRDLDTDLCADVVGNAVKSLNI